ncbi:fascin domain-containing protein [Actinoplanes sp. CA-030573]|uniref:fascin domain-containing protein n=1 Tax=Actinoplanes sp. CA-030573 TaxID=3239898 RepID=UPI003D8E6CAF
MRRSRTLLATLMSVVTAAAGLLVFQAPAAAYTANNCRQVALRSVANGLYVSTEAAYPGKMDGLLRARAQVIGPWEKFYLCQIIGGGRSGSSEAFDSTLDGNNGWWTTERADGDYVRARPDGTIIDVWEEFYTVRASGCSLECYAIRSVDANRWLSAEVGVKDPNYNGYLRARGTEIGPWEKFDFIWLA